MLCVPAARCASAGSACKWMGGLLMLLMEFADDATFSARFCTLTREGAGLIKYLPPLGR